MYRSAIHPRSQLLRALSLFGFLALMLMNSQALWAQHTDVSKNGVGGKIEMDYDAAERVIETRTIGADGKLLQKVDYEYLPGYYSAQQTDTTYWPNGNVRKRVRHTYDESSNFTGELAQSFDGTGKQVSGHKLTHDPWTNIYRCYDWQPTLKDYSQVNCPAGEEGGGEEREERKFTYEEVTRHLDAARKAPVGEAQEVRSSDGEVGLVLPRVVSAGERISGTVVENPAQYEHMHEVTVTRVKLPLPEGKGSGLLNWILEAPGQDPQPADGPVTFVVPRSESRLPVTFRRADHHDVFVSMTLEFSLVAQESNPLSSFKAAALCLKGQLCEVDGPYSGDSHKTFAAWDDEPAKIVAETPEAAFVTIPERTGPGAHALIIAEGSRLIAYPIAVGNFFIKNNGLELRAEQKLIVSAMLDGPGDIVESSWSANQDASSRLQEVRRAIPDFQLGARENEESHSDGKHDSDESGEILMVLTNRAPARTLLRSSKDGMLVFHLSKDSFSRGQFKYDLVVEAKSPGKVDVEGRVIPFLAPVAGQEFTLKPEPR